MIRFLLLVFAIVIFVLLAGNWAIHSDQVRWAEGAVAAFFLTHLPFDDVALPAFTRKAKPAPPA